MTVSGKTKVCGILACPVGHTMSPLIQNYFAEQTGTDLVYVPFKTEPEALKEAVSGLDALNILGANVTVPHKQAIIPYLKDIDDTAAAIGAVNTLVHVSGGYKGYNTDAEGFLSALQKCGVDIAGRVCILIGAGGAARAAAFILAREGAKEIICLNRTADHAIRLMSDINSHFPGIRTQVLPLDSWRQIDEKDCLAVQTTSVGMTPDIKASPIDDEEFFKKLSFAMDVIYTPSRTRFLELAEKAGVPVGNGLDMLLYQGLAAFRLWNPGAVVSAEMMEGAREKVSAFLEGSR